MGLTYAALARSPLREAGDLPSALQNYEIALRLAPNEARTRRKRVVTYQRVE